MNRAGGVACMFYGYLIKQMKESKRYLNRAEETVYILRSTEDIMSPCVFIVASVQAFHIMEI